MSSATDQRTANTRRLSLAAFMALVVATVAAFFIIQHLKVSTPFVSGITRPYPAVINPLNSRSCYDRARREQVGRATEISFYLLHASDKVDVYTINATGTRIATIAHGRFMKAVLFPHEVPTHFRWDGRERSGSIAPNGIYYFQVHLVHQGRTVTISSNSGPLPVTVDTRASCP
jgi:hypothetical protein